MTKDKKSNTPHNKNKLGNHRFFDLKMATIGGAFMATVVYIVNSKHGFDQAIVASLKQGVYTFFMGGVLMKICENLSIQFKPFWLSIIIAVISATIISVGLTYGLHSLKGTPETVNSTLATVILGIPGFTWWALRKRRQWERL